MTFAPAIGFEYRASALLPRLRAVIAALALLAVGTCGLAAWLKLALAAAVMAVFVLGLRRPIGSRVVAAGVDPEGGWSLRYADGGDAVATLASFRVIGSLVLLHLALDGRKRETLLLTPDNSDADIRRRLRMRLAVVRTAVAAAADQRLPPVGPSGTLPRRRGPTS